VQDRHAAEIEDTWLRLTGTAPDALRTFLLDLIPDVDAWAVRSSPSGRDPEVLAVTPSHLYSITRSDVEGVPAFGFERWPLDRTRVAKVVQWREAESLRRRWTIRMDDHALMLDTGGDLSDLERLLRLLLERAG
jgi:hypothetical protein